MENYNSNIRFTGQKRTILPNSCTVCGDSIVKNRVTFKHTRQNRKSILNNNSVYYSKNPKIPTSSTRQTKFVLNNTQSKKLDVTEDAPINLITATGHVKHNNICVKYVTKTIPEKEKFRINKICINSIKQN